MPTFEKLDFSGIAGRVLIVGDLHGNIDLLYEKLRSLDYDKTADRVVLLGDLIDRGPASERAIELEFPRVRGNHEDMLISYANGDERAGRNLLHNGGIWAMALTDAELQQHASFHAQAPIALEIATPGGRTIGCVHAEVPGGDWLSFRSGLQSLRPGEDSELIQEALWGRGRIKQIRAGYAAKAISGIDHVFFGHTILSAPLRAGNTSYIDTGAFHTGDLTVIDADAWIASE